MRKIDASVHLSDEMVFEHKAVTDPRYKRKAVRISTPPTSEVWERYRAAKVGLEALEAYEFTVWGGSDYGTEVPEPEATISYEYHETVEDWLARCRTLNQELG